MNKRVDISDAQMIDFKGRYMEGESLRTLANEANCTVPTIRRKLADAGVEIRPRGRPRGAKNEKDESLKEEVTKEVPFTVVAAPPVKESLDIEPSPDSRWNF